MEKIQKFQLSDHHSAVDRISDLPCDVLDNIMERLPTKDAAKTIILSRKWRCKWVNLSKLVLDDSCAIRGGKLHVNYLVDCIYHVLFAHHGQIHTFKLSTILVPEFCHFDVWIRFLISNGIKELTLLYGIFDMSEETFYKVPPCLFSYEQLTHLHLKFTTVIPPDTFKGFRNLVSLHLQRSSIDSDVLTDLVSNSPILEKLVLQRLDVINSFKIHAPKLKYLTMKGGLGENLLINCPVLRDITFKLFQYGHKVICKMIQEQGFRLSSLKRFKLSCDFLEYLLIRNVKTPYPACASNYVKFPELKEIYRSDRAELECILTLLQFFSNLQELNIKIKKSCVLSIESFKCLQELFGQESWCFNLLRFAKIHISLDSCESCDSNMYLEWEIIKLVLAHSPILEKMTISILDKGATTRDKGRIAKSLNYKIMLMKESLPFKPASAQVNFAS